jgi:hypothetical protein
MRDTIAQLKELQKIKPDAIAQAAQKAMLLQQVAASARTDKSFSAGFVLSVKEFFLHEIAVMAQPAASIAVLILLVIGGGIFSISAASEATPGSFLYTIKLIGEKTQFALTPDQESKVKLSVSFAERRVAEMAVIAGAQNQAELKKVADNLVLDIMSIQSGLEKVETNDPATAATIARDVDAKAAALRQKLVAARQLLAQADVSNARTIDDAIAGVDAVSLKALSTLVKTGNTGDTTAVGQRVADKIESAKEKISEVKENLNTVFSAGLGRSEQGVQLYSNTDDAKSAKEAVDQKTEAASQVISEAETLLSNSDYSGALEKISQSEQLLQEANDVAEQQDDASSEATSSTTPEVKGAVEINEDADGETTAAQSTTTVQETTP